MDSAHAADHGDHGSHDEHAEHVEHFPDSGIVETSRPIYGWLWIAYVAGLAFFNGYFANQFFFQSEEYPKYGTGWQANTVLTQFNADAETRGLPSEAISGQRMNRKTNPSEADAYTWSYVGQR